MTNASDTDTAPSSKVTVLPDGTARLSAPDGFFGPSSPKDQAVWLCAECGYTVPDNGDLDAGDKEHECAKRWTGPELDLYDQARRAEGITVKCGDCGKLLTGGSHVCLKTSGRRIRPNQPEPVNEKQRLAQDLFLKAFAVKGTIKQALDVCKVGRTTVYDWDQGDVQGFTKRFEHARHQFRETLEQAMFDLLKKPEGNRGSDILRIFALKAHYPEKYKDAVVVVDDTAKRLLDRLGRGEALPRDGR